MVDLLIYEDYTPRLLGSVKSTRMEKTMIKKKSLLRTCVIGAAVLFVCCFATATQANTIYVGNCHTNSYATITLALAAAVPGTVIDVCPGYYAEQVTISGAGFDNITLQGIAYTHNGTTEDSAVIIPPSGGLVQNGTVLDSDEPGPALAQVLVQNASGVTIKNITVDAQSSQTCGSGNIIGIYYENASGTVTGSAARNQIENDPNSYGDQCGWGIAAESNGAQTLTVTNSSVHNFQKNGIVARGTNSAGLTLVATGNTVIGIGPVPTDAGQNGIEIAFGATGTVKSNYVADVLNPSTNGATGILLYATTGSPVVELNTVESSDTGIAVVFDGSFGGGGTGATISTNHIGGTQTLDAIDLCSASETADSNVIYNATNSGIHLDDSCTGGGTNSTVKTNTINEACAGILSGPSASGNTTTPNTYYNNGYEQLTGTDACTLPSGPNNLAKGKAAQAPKKAGKARP
jgi:hypothetical protein